MGLLVARAPKGHLAARCCAKISLLSLSRYDASAQFLEQCEQANAGQLSGSRRVWHVESPKFHVFGENFCKNMTRATHSLASPLHAIDVLMDIVPHSFPLALPTQLCVYQLSCKSVLTRRRTTVQLSRSSACCQTHTKRGRFCRTKQPGSRSSATAASKSNSHLGRE